MHTAAQLKGEPMYPPSYPKYSPHVCRLCLSTYADSASPLDEEQAVNAAGRIYLTKVTCSGY